MTNTARETVAEALTHAKSAAWKLYVAREQLQADDATAAGECRAIQGRLMAIEREIEDLALRLGDKAAPAGRSVTMRVKGV